MLGLQVRVEVNAGPSDNTIAHASTEDVSMVSTAQKKGCVNKRKRVCQQETLVRQLIEILTAGISN